MTTVGQQLLYIYCRVGPKLKGLLYDAERDVTS